VGLAAIALVSVSAFMHAGWNAASRKRRPAAAFFLVANTTGTVLLLPILVMHVGYLSAIPVAVWWMLALTGASMALSYAALAGAYRSGDMSVAYPVARSLPILAVAGVESALDLGAPLGALAVGGMALVVAGCLVVPREKLFETGIRSYLNATFALALLAAVGITGYSVIDHAALATLRTALPSVGKTGSVLIYAPLEGIAASVSLTIYCLLHPAERASLKEILRSEKRAAALTGVAIYATYLLVLLAMNFAANASYIVAFRQISIPLGAILGVAALREPARLPKLVGVLAIIAGLVLVALSSR
jgi:uncharacterized membrane protein